MLLVGVPAAPLRFFSASTPRFHFVTISDAIRATSLFGFDRSLPTTMPALVAYGKWLTNVCRAPVDTISALGQRLSSRRGIISPRRPTATWIERLTHEELAQPTLSISSVGAASRLMFSRIAMMLGGGSLATRAFDSDLMRASSSRWSILLCVRVCATAKLGGDDGWGAFG